MASLVGVTRDGSVEVGIVGRLAPVGGHPLRILPSHYANLRKWCEDSRPHCGRVPAFDATTARCAGEVLDDARIPGGTDRRLQSAA